MKRHVVDQVVDSLGGLVQWLHRSKLKLHAGQPDGGSMHGGRMSEVVEG